jgi:hypothetical protein
MPRVTVGVTLKRSLPPQRQRAPSISLNFVALPKQWWRLHTVDKFSLFYVPLKNFSLVYIDVIIGGEGLHSLGLCSALRAFEKAGIFIVPRLLWHGTLGFFWSHPKDRPIQSLLMTHKKWRIYYNPDPPGETIYVERFSIGIKQCMMNQSII